MLRDDMELYTKLTGEDGTHVPIIKLGAYLDGYKKGLSVLEDIKAEIEAEKKGFDIYDNHDKDVLYGLQLALEIIDKHISGKEQGADT